MFPPSKQSEHSCTLRVTAYAAIFAILVFFHFCTPPVWDDWSYLEASWKDVLPSSFHEYFTWNSRVFSTALTRCFSLSPEWIVDLFNTFGFFLYAWLIIYVAFGRQWHSRLRSWQAIILCWVFSVATVPAFGEVFLWQCGCASYLWPNIACLAFLSVLRSLFEGEASQSSLNGGGDSNNATILLPYALIALLAGWSNYNSGPVMLAAGILAAWKARQHLSSKSKRAATTMAICCLVGCALMLLSPGNAGRLEGIRNTIDYKPLTTLSCLGRILKPHLRVLPLYILIFVLMRRRIKRGQWTLEDRLVFWGLISAGLATQLVFFASPAKPPLRSWQITFALISAASLRVILPSVLQARRRILWNIVLYFLAALPLACAPKTWKIRQWYDQSVKQLKSHQGSQTDVVLPYWPFKSDKLFCFINNFVEPEDVRDWKNQSVARAFNVRTVRQSALRCTYAGKTGYWVLQGSSYDTNLDATRTEWKLLPQCNLDKSQYLHIAYPARKTKFYAPLAMWRRWVGGDSDTLTEKELRQRGYVITSLLLPKCRPGEFISVTWIRNKGFSQKPETPILYIAVSSTSSTGSSFTPVWPQPGT